ncbi:hypothetical protein [Streptomyces roseicoloratus]|uniref:Lipoprotein n=1 Tax=Streptomyces roseicoloratus TaxID=2508722 RepID=A0ABY9RX73_9ACTN|nr:hypothetical protein [Streptomyces roseicoloratus]WMX46780.1 hypothetical protein RGF97_20850 [Streptomyces roseicoloratus]
MVGCGGGSAVAPDECEEKRRRRPGYLVEDGEIWQQDGRRVAPSVID